MYDSALAVVETVGLRVPYKYGTLMRAFMNTAR